VENSNILLFIFRREKKYCLMFLARWSIQLEKFIFKNMQ